MPRVLTVDDSRAIRNLVGKQLTQMGLEFDEAEDGVQGLERLAEASYDLVILDITMPNLDGPGMAAKVRESGNMVPILMLTSESKSSIIAGLIKLGISDYILKPFKAEEFQSKVRKIIKGPIPEAPVSLDEPAAIEGIAGGAAAGAKHGEAARQFVDVLVVDDMENVGKKLRSMVPAHFSLNSATSGQAALSLCRERFYRLVLIDMVMPEVNSVTLMNQLRSLQNHAAFIALAMRSTNNVRKEVEQDGFDGLLFKPFSQDEIEDLLLRYFDDQELVVSDDNILKVSGFSGKEDRLDKYFLRMTKQLEEGIEKMAAACFDEAIVDISNVPPRPDRAVRLLVRLQEQSKERGLVLRVVASQELTRVLRTFDETSKLQVWNSVDAAKAATAA